MARICRFEPVTLAEWLAKHPGEVVQIGGKHGTGMLYAGKAGAFTLDCLRSAYRMDFSGIPVLDVYPSQYVGHIVMIDSARSGKAEIPPELMPKRDPETIPMEHYIRFADYICAAAVRDYKQALFSLAIGSPYHGAEADAMRAEKFILSERFSVLLQNGSGEEVIRLVKKQVRKEVEEHERKRKERGDPGKWLY